MKLNYLKFMENAKKMVKNVTTRPVLKGVHHDNDGNLTVTDSHRLYHVKNMNAPKDVVIHAETGDDITGEHGAYPNVNNLVKMHEHDEPLAQIMLNELRDVARKLKAMQQLAVAEGLKKDDVRVTINHTSLDLDNVETVSASLKLTSVGESEKVTFKLQYIIELVEFFDDMKMNDLVINIFDTHKPIRVTSSTSENILAIVMPIRHY